MYAARGIAIGRPYARNGAGSVRARFRGSSDLANRDIQSSYMLLIQEPVMQVPRPKVRQRSQKARRQGHPIGVTPVKPEMVRADQFCAFADDHVLSAQDVFGFLAGSVLAEAPHVVVRPAATLHLIAQLKIYGESAPEAANAKTAGLGRQYKRRAVAPTAQQPLTGRQSLLDRYGR